MTPAANTGHTTPKEAEALSREDVDAAHRGERRTPAVDDRGLAAATQLAIDLLERFPDGVLRHESFRDEVTVVVTPEMLIEVATYVRDAAGYALLSDLSPCDRLGSAHEHPKRFSVAYHVTKLAPGAPRIRLQVWVDDGESIPSVMGIWPTADWHEREAFDFYGIEFTGRAGLRRLIMPEDWVGHPLRRDYPLGGEPVTFTNSPREL